VNSEEEEEAGNIKICGCFLVLSVATVVLCCFSERDVCAKYILHQPTNQTCLPRNEMVSVSCVMFCAFYFVAKSVFENFFNK